MRFLAGAIAGSILTILIAIGVVSLIPWWMERPPSIHKGTTLVLPLSGPIPEAPPGTLDPFATPPLTTFAIWDILRKAAVDDRISAILLQPAKPSAGWAKLTEIRDAILRFRQQSHKPVYATLRTASLRDYYLASAADRISAIPGDFLELKGMRVELLYARKAFDKLGILPEFEAIGRYKDGADTFTRSEMTAETKEVLNNLLDARIETFLTAVAPARKKPPATLRELLEEGPYLTSDALTNGLIDAAEFPDQIEASLAKALNQKELTKLDAADYQRLPASKLNLEDGPAIAILAAEGDILRHPIPYFAEDTLAPDSIRPHIRKLRDDSQIRAVILRIDSPGGDAIASEEILRELRLLAEKKPLIVSMSDVAASGGYAIAMAAKRILAQPESVTGSIGVFYGKVSFQGLMDKLGLNMQSITRGKHAAMDSEYQSLSPESRAKLRQLIEKTYHDFVAQVAASRHRSHADIDKVAQGRVWLGAEAAKNGLIDELGGLSAAIAAALREANLPPTTKPTIAVYPPRPSLRQAWEQRLRIYSSYAPQAAVWKRMSVLE
ncbi:MAG: signal peptide peptidase SppA [Acidobacteria bacterium]|nr:signal peptide peptidase SppA [Acidobacteriota bacterium]